MYGAENDEDLMQDSVGMKFSYEQFNSFSLAQAQVMFPLIRMGE